MSVITLRNSGHLKLYIIILCKKKGGLVDELVMTKATFPSFFKVQELKDFQIPIILCYC